MKKNISICLVGLFIGLVFSTQAFSLVLYDDFSGTYIDQTKWEEGEWVREIVGGKLISKAASPNPDAVSSFPYIAYNRLAFLSPNSVHSFQADVTLIEDTIINTARTRARMNGQWYNDGTPGGGQTGDIYTEISLRKEPDGLKCNWFVLRYTNPDATTYEILKSGNFATIISVGTPYTLFMRYDSANHQFIFRIGGEEKTFGPANLPLPAGNASNPNKVLATRVEVDDATSSAYISATFDNVYKNGVLYDDFSSPTIDPTKWGYGYYEFVREISEGELRSEVRSSSGNNSSIFNQLTFVDPSSKDAIQAKVTPVAYENEEGLNIVARIAGIYYNDGTPGGGYLGDVGAEVFIGGLNGEANPAAGWAVWTYADSEGNHPTLIETENFSKPILLGNTYALLIGWTGSNFIFRIDDEEARYAPAAAINPPNNTWKEIATRIMSPAGKEAMMEALFDDVMVAASCCPYINVSPTLGNFGNVAAGSTSDQTVTVANVGSGDLILGTIGSPSAPFSIAGGTCTNNQTLAPSGSCSLIIRFAPTASGVFASSFSIPSDALGESNVTVNLTGGSGVNFGNVAAGSTSDQTVTVTNVGSGDLILGTIGSPSAPFSIAGGTCANNQTLTPSGSCSLIIRFAPTASGAFTSNFSILFDAPVESNVTVNLTGGSGPDLTGEWSSLTQVCKSSKKGNQCSITGTFIVKNIGKNIAASSNVNFYLSEDNTYDEGDTFLKKVAAGKLKVNGSKTIKLTYKLPLNNTASGKYVIAVVDADNTVVEADESNNTIAYKIP